MAFRSKVFCTVLLLLAGFGIRAQHSFPKDWIGNWKGEVKWFKTAGDTPQVVKMELRIQPAGTAGQYTWRLIYGTENKDDRPYILKPVDTAKGHWLLDEVNGILIDQYYVGGRLSCVFTVMNNTIVNNCWREGDKLVVEFYSVSVSPVSTTGKDTEDSPIVNTYRVKSFQRAELRR